MEKKTKLSVSGSAKKSIKNIEFAKTKSKNSVVIDKQQNKFSSKSGTSKFSGIKSKQTNSFNRGLSVKQKFEPKLSPSTSNFEKRKLAEQRATKRLKGQNEIKDKKTLKTES